VPAGAFADALGLGHDELARLNPGLKATVWRGDKYLPRGYDLRVPGALGNSAAVLARVPDAQWRKDQVPDLYHVVQRGETLSGIAPRYGARVSDLIAINNLSSRGLIRAGQKLVLPAGAEAATRSKPVLVAGPKARPEPPPQTERPPEPVAPEPVAAEPVLVAIAESAPNQGVAADDLEERGIDSDGDGQLSTEELSSDQVADAGLSPLLADPSDYSVARDGTIQIQEGETLGHYAEWLGVRASDVRVVNNMQRRSNVRVGRRLRLEFPRATPAEFEAARIAYHQAMLGEFFARFRIVGRVDHTIRPGESIWVLAGKRYNRPVWLLRQYNPYLDLENLRPSTRVVIPVLG
jgi:membrane-bound lytic murein transglycosylase D